MSVVEDDDVPALSAETFLVLQDFYNEQAEKDKRLKQAVDDNLLDSVEIEEDWQLSQFWYDDNTINTLAHIALKTIGPLGKVALISCPSLYRKIKEGCGPDQQVTVFEFDKRFSIYGADFHYYDYNSPLELGDIRPKYYDLVIADPPFLSEECLKKTTLTMRFLTMEKIILCTGAKMEELAEKMNLQKTRFAPKHKKNLANEFCCFANFDINI
ncbi:unnamed protein product [Brassicogethes aeneus]|uniref:Protein-lysine N-methyltransferase MELIAE_LOCUS273 n=1 Tax=Brassicogethes aeneus TaxID=1431903 RepID=A0A9P0FAQ3_BRAAE|nr:unnamed protein product [Brassicogethes aeneus]